MKRWFPYIVVTLAALFVAVAWIPKNPASGAPDLPTLGKVPVLVGGRVKPLDTVARNSLLIIHGKQELRLADGRRASAMQWLTEVLFDAPAADQQLAFVIQNPDVLGLFGWEQGERKYFSYTELSPFLKQIDEQGEQSEKLQSAERSAYQSSIINLRNALILYQRLKNSVGPEGPENFARELETFAAALPAGGKAATAHEAGAPFDKEKLDLVAEAMRRYDAMSSMAYILAVPPVGGDEHWHSIGDTLLQAVGAGAIHPVATLYAQIGDAHRAKAWPQFNQQVATLRDLIAGEQPNATGRSAYEFLFNRLQPFSQSMTLYVLAFLLACGSWLGWQRPLSRAAFYVLLLALAIHTFGLISRMYLQERPPVTNLYSSAIFIGWGAVLARR